MSVDFVRPEVVEKAPVWRKVKYAAAGGDAVRSNSYILTVNPHDGSRENTLRNEQRLQRATYFNATGRTLHALVGIAFGKWPEVKLPTALDVLTAGLQADPAARLRTRVRALLTETVGQAG